MQLADAGVLRSRLTLPDDAGVNKVISEALDAASVYLESLLQTSMASSTYEDTFIIDSHIYRAFSGLYRLKLANGFVTRSSVVVEVCDNLFAATQGWVQLAANEFIVSNPEKGFVELQDSYGIRDRYVRASYTSGFTDDLDGVPLWLQEAAMAYAIKMMSVQQVGDDKPEMAKVYALLDTHKSTILDGRLRISSHAIPSMISV